MTTGGTVTGVGAGEGEGSGVGEGDALGDGEGDGVGDGRKTFSIEGAERMPLAEAVI